MLKLALCVAMGAGEQKAVVHITEDFLKRDDVNWLKNTDFMERGATLPTVSYEDLDIMTMEMPPAFRGYGVKKVTSSKTQ